MEGCYKKYSRHECDSTERDRMLMNLEQPRTQHNYTEIVRLRFKTSQILMAFSAL